MVVREFHQALARSPETAVAVAAIKVTVACVPPCRDMPTAGVLMIW